MMIYKRLDNYSISSDPKRINKIEKNKSVVEDVIIIQIIPKTIDEKLSVKEMTGINLKEYCSKFIEWSYKLKVSSITKVYPTQTLDFKSILKKYEQLNADMNRLKNEYKKVSMKSDKMRIDDELFDKEMKVKQIIEKFKEGE